MSETNFNNGLESEIAELSRQIEAKRRLLEQEKGLVIEDREAVSAVVKDRIISATEEAPLTSVTSDQDQTKNTNSNPSSSDYLDNLDETTTETINSLIAKLPVIGLQKTIALATEMNPYYLDVLHDALVNRLYEELVSQGYLK
ncbi:MAG: hypothetical protein UT40_C0009G0010 [Candidatus Woesebacteria bacterium GW2011_GWA1_39_21b]|uniref:Uncharacterized protein n=2 Tax=Patescibacteria group TaxID=1783273 RepID=A0A1G2QB34_9BACT|nr:MAG: hypothetical protein UT40_C0009G0010 [Candidatus Woesebacteria bacterium GW2011_GWA1_39_21b]KKS77454.1 MAG: hypothetical protein UV50_C0005G0009 [Parcubacteria group bacterium GW2011_GWB1_42_9]KKS88976.1 MAG: hypothetical protein UV64_C0015G0004 [Parcubacteria group bacterium GW2011_GWC1_43_11b]OHA57770.1 MAG: hypothetical protein A2370_02520 [Candidatus Vogelbacteria bacterium RIFOXYB1_FULL_42_16]